MLVGSGGYAGLGHYQFLPLKCIVNQLKHAEPSLCKRLHKFITGYFLFNFKIHIPIWANCLRLMAGAVPKQHLK